MPVPRLPASEAATAAARRRSLAVAVLPSVAGAVLLAVLAVLWSDRLPDPIAAHLDAGGHADGFMARGTFAAVLVALTLLPGVLFGTLTARAYGPGRRTLAAFGCGTAGFLTYLGVRMLMANLDAADATEVTFPLWETAAAAGVLVAAAVAGHVLAGPAPAAHSSTAPPPAAGRTTAGPGETLVWSRHATSRPIAVLGAALPVAAVPVGLFAGWAAAVPMLVAGVPLALMASVRATADASGFTVTFGPLPRPRVHIPLARVDEARTRPVRPLRDFGGWGYRVVPAARAVVLRSGDAVELRLADGSSFVVTIDDADTAARVVNTLADRARQGA